MKQTNHQLMVCKLLNRTISLVVYSLAEEAKHSKYIFSDFYPFISLKQAKQFFKISLSF